MVPCRFDLQSNNKGQIITYVFVGNLDFCAPAGCVPPLQECPQKRNKFNNNKLTLKTLIWLKKKKRRIHFFNQSRSIIKFEAFYED